MVFVGFIYGEEEGIFVVVFLFVDVVGIVIGVVGVVCIVGSYCEVLCREEGKCLEIG